MKVESEVKLSTPFSEELNDADSDEFKNLEEKVIDLTKPSLEATAEENDAKVAVKVLSFSFQSFGFAKVSY